MEDFLNRSLPETFKQVLTHQQQRWDMYAGVIAFWVRQSYEALVRRASSDPDGFKQGDFGFEMYVFDSGVRMAFTHSGAAFKPLHLQQAFTREYWQNRDPVAMRRLLDLPIKVVVESKDPEMVGLLAEFNTPDRPGQVRALDKDDEAISAGARIQIDLLNDLAVPITGKDVPNSVSIFKQVVDFRSKNTKDGGYTGLSKKQTDQQMAEYRAQDAVMTPATQEFPQAGD